MSGSAAAKTGAAENNAERIARAAARLFAADGYDATSVRNIVEAASVTKPTLYYYFASKEALALSLLTGAIEGLAASDRAILDGEATASEKLAAMIEARFRLCREKPDLARFAYATFLGPRSVQFAAALEEVSCKLMALLREAVSGLAAERIIAPERIDDCAVAVRGLITVYMLDYLYSGVPHAEGLAPRIVSDLLQGFASRAAGAETAIGRN